MPRSDGRSYRISGLAPDWCAGDDQGVGHGRPNRRADDRDVASQRRPTRAGRRRGACCSRSTFAARGGDTPPIPDRRAATAAPACGGSSMKPVRIALLGAGLIGREHAPMIAANPRTRGPSSSASPTWHPLHANSRPDSARRCATTTSRCSMRPRRTRRSSRCRTRCTWTRGSPACRAGSRCWSRSRPHAGCDAAGARRRGRRRADPGPTQPAPRAGDPGRAPGHPPGRPRAVGRGRRPLRASRASCYAAQLDNWVDVVRGKAELVVSGRQGALTLAVALAIATAITEACIVHVAAVHA